MDNFDDATAVSFRNAAGRTSRGGLPCTNGRVLSVERLDSAERAETEKNLRDIARINRWFGGHRTLVRLLGMFVGTKDRFSLLDVGAASGDMGRHVQKRFPNAQVVSLDRRPLHLKTVTTPRIAADARSLPFADASFDLVMCSSLLRHFANNEVIALLRGMRRIARRAVIVLDIERHLLAYFFLPLTRLFLHWSELGVYDGCASVEAAYRVSELEFLARSLVPARVAVQHHLPRSSYTGASELGSSKKFWNRCLSALF